MTFGYDGDQKRIRKTTPDKETLYFGELYERVTTKKPGTTTEHRYYVRSPERVVAVVTRGGAEPGTRYVHVDHLGSVDALTKEGGGVVERRSYDPFGQRRNPVWGKPPPASFASKTTLGFTGHEGDDELGLVNMKGRVYDPKLGRFLTTDPVVADLYFGQSFNAYSYVLNNPLAFVDPSGFQPAVGVVSQPGHPDVPLPDLYVTPGPEFRVEPYGPPPPPAFSESPAADTPPSGDAENAEAVGVGAAVPATDVDTTGSSPVDEPQPVTTAPEEWSQNSYVQIEGGYLAGLSIGLVPFGAVGHQTLDALDVLDHGTPEARLGLAVGQIVGGVITVAGGATGTVLGGLATSTGIGAAVGVPAVAVSAGVVAGGLGNIGAGIRGLLTTGSGSGSTGPQAPPTSKAGAETVKDALSGLRAGRSSGVKVVDSADDLESLFGRLSAGGRPVQGTTYPGRLVELPDGTRIGFRTASKSGGSTIDIKLPNGIERKVHVQ